mgnify:FL=1
MHFYQFGEEWEMYDLKVDPDELNNIYGKKNFAEIQKNLTERLFKLRKFYDDDSDTSIRTEYIEKYRRKS